MYRPCLLSHAHRRNNAIHSPPAPDLITAGFGDFVFLSSCSTRFPAIESNPLYFGSLAALCLSLSVRLIVFFVEDSLWGMRRPISTGWYLWKHQRWHPLLTALLLTPWDHIFYTPHGSIRNALECFPSL